MGSGKGSPEGWVAVVKPGRVMFELAGVPEPLAKEALRLAGDEAARQDQVREAREAVISLKAKELRELTDDELDREAGGDAPGALQPALPVGDRRARERRGHAAREARDRAHPDRRTRAEAALETK